MVLLGIVILFAFCLLFMLGRNNFSRLEKFDLIILVVVLFMFLVALNNLTNNVEQENTEQVDIDTEQVDLLKTVAHLDLSNRDDLELVAMDATNDVAYYRYIQPDRDVNVGDTVHLYNGIEATLVSVDAIGFTFECDEVLEAGMSGTAVLNENGTQIGYISKRLETGVYYGIWS